MTGNLGMLVIAEGVETEQQKSFLMKYGCVHFQAYLLGRPLPLEEFEALLSRIGKGMQTPKQVFR